MERRRNIVDADDLAITKSLMESRVKSARRKENGWEKRPWRHPAGVPTVGPTAFAKRTISGPTAILLSRFPQPKLLVRMRGLEPPLPCEN